MMSRRCPARYGVAQPINGLEQNEGRVLFHSEFGALSLPQFETITQVLHDPAQWNVHSSAQAQRSPNGAIGSIGFIEGTLGTGLANFNCPTEADYRRVAYLSQLAQSESLRAIVDGGRLGVAAGGPNDQPSGGSASGDGADAFPLCLFFLSCLKFARLMSPWARYSSTPLANANTHC